MKKFVQKGFTLIELIIVMALFSLVMYGVLQFLDPVTKFFVRSSNFETTTSCVDNMKRAIEGNLKYADRVRAYSNYDESTIGANVQTFWESFFQKRELMDCKGEIKVMYFDNSTSGLTAWGAAQNVYQLTDFNKEQLNRGKIKMYTFHFDKDSVWQAGTPVEWYVNQKMYANYNYMFKMGDDDLVVTPPASSGSSSDGSSSSGSPVPAATFNPSDFAITIYSREIVSDKAHPGTWIESDTTNASVASFSMKNVLDGANKYTTPLLDYKLIRNTTPGHDSYRISNTLGDSFKYVIDPTPISRYAPLQSIAPAADEDFPSFYFIFTQAETVYDAGERIYQGGGFVAPSLPTDDPAYDSAYFSEVDFYYSSST